MVWKFKVEIIKHIGYRVSVDEFYKKGFKSYHTIMDDIYNMFLAPHSMNVIECVCIYIQLFPCVLTTENVDICLW